MASQAKQNLVPFEMMPRPRVPEVEPVRMRVIGPGRRERDYQNRVGDLEGEISKIRAREARLAMEIDAQSRELQLSERIERGCQRHLDRMETRLWQSDQQKNRLILSLGGLQKENELLRGKLEELQRLSGPDGSMGNAALPAATRSAEAETAPGADAQVRKSSRSKSSRKSDKGHRGQKSWWSNLLSLL